MSYQLGMSSIDENGNISGGQAGDQTGQEVFLRTWYSHPWIKVLRPKSTTIGQLIAEIAVQGCENDKIGYDQSQRNTLRTQARSYNFDLSRIISPCECDCSSFAAVCAEGAGLTVTYSGLNAPTSGTLANSVSDCIILTDSKYLTSGDYLKKGDMLIADGHVAICVENGSQVTPPEPEDTDAYRIWTLLLSKIGNEYGVAGAMGNMFAESGLHSDRVQGDIPYSTYSQEYTQDVDNSVISEYDFVHNGPHGGGYGLCQWTYYTRKQGLYNLKEEKGVSIANVPMQIDYLYYELTNSYSSVLNVLETAKTVRQASDSFLFNFENPADQSEAVQRTRASYGQYYYDLYANGGTGGGGEPPEPPEPPNPPEPPIGGDVDDWDYIWGVLGIDWEHDFQTLDDCYNFDIDALPWDKITLSGYDSNFNPINGNSIYDKLVNDTLYKVQQLREVQVTFLKSIELEDRVLMNHTFNHNKRQIGYNFTQSRLTFTTLSYKIKSVEKTGFLQLQHESETMCNLLNPQYIKIDIAYMSQKLADLQALLDAKIAYIKAEIQRRLNAIIAELESQTEPEG